VKREFDMYDFNRIQKRQFFSPEPTGGVDDPEYAAYKKQLEFKNTLANELKTDAAFAELHAAGHVDAVLKDFGAELNGNVALLKKLALGKHKEAETQKTTIKAPEAKVTPDVKQFAPQDAPGTPTNSIPKNQTMTQTEKDALMSEKVDWSNLDLDRLDKVSSFHKSLLVMITNPDVRRQTRISATELSR
jgi:hypothetical protein